MRYKASTLRIIEKLKELYPEGLCSLQYEKDYELLFVAAVRPVHRRPGESGDPRRCSPGFLHWKPSPRRTPESGRIHPLLRVLQWKIQDLVACAQQLLERFGGKVPDNMEDLTSLPGVGRKTANLILGTCTASPPMCATPTVSASPGGWASPTGPRTR